MNSAEMDEWTPNVAPRINVDGCELPGEGTDIGERPDRVRFIIPGAPKAGTTAMSWFLAQHPDICIPPKKELNFFVRSNRYRQGLRNGYRDYHDAFVNYRPGQLAGEASTHYLPSRVFARRSHRYNPDLKLICLLRNPIDRAYSNYIMERDRGERWSFGRAIRHERLRCLLYRNRRRLRSHPYSYVRRGLYAPQIRRLLRNFPREQVLIVLTDDLQDHHERVLREVYAFLGVRQVNPPPRARVFAADYDPMLDEDRRTLQRVFRRHIEDLSRLIGRDLSHWT